MKLLKNQILKGKILLNNQKNIISLLTLTIIIIQYISKTSIQGIKASRKSILTLFSEYSPMCWFSVLKRWTP